MSTTTADNVGLCSATLRALTAPEVLRLAAGAGLRCIEWGADVHASPSDRGLARLRRATLESGLRVCSYGSYWRAGISSPEEFRSVAAAAMTLGTSRIRIWAGSLGAAEASAGCWAEVVAATREAALVAADHGAEVAFEFHGGTLTDTVDGTLRLLDDVDRPNVSTYWQQPINAGDDEAIEGLERLMARVSGLHVFSWWPGTTRLLLAQRNRLWSRVIQALVRHDKTNIDLLLEFVPKDDPALIADEAATLRALMAGAESREGPTDV